MNKFTKLLESVNSIEKILKESRYYSSDDDYDAARDAKGMGYSSLRAADDDNWGQDPSFKRSPEDIARAKADAENNMNKWKQENAKKEALGAQEAEKAWNEAGGDQNPNAGEEAVKAVYKNIRTKYTPPNALNPNNDGMRIAGAAIEWLAKKLGFADARSYWDADRKKQNYALHEAKVKLELLETATTLLEKANKKIGQNPKRFTKKGEKQIAHITKSEIEAGKSPEEAKKIACATATKTGNRKAGK
jgi:hypothetical protein